MTDYNGLNVSGSFSNYEINKIDLHGGIVFRAGTVVDSPLYRGLVGSEYVYSVGVPPVGATDVVIVGSVSQ